MNKFKYPVPGPGTWFKKFFHFYFLNFIIIHMTYIINYTFLTYIIHTYILHSYIHEGQDEVVAVLGIRYY